MESYGRILLVEDDEQLAVVLRDTLVDAGYECECAKEGDEGIARGLNAQFDLAILDVNLPKVSGLDVCRELKRGKPEMAVMMLTARGEETDIIVGLEIGADEYLVKPISPKELVARVRARLRERQRIQRTSGGPALPSLLRIGNLELDLDRKLLRSMGQAVDLTAIEFDFMAFLATNAGRPYSREDLLETIWGTDNHNYWPNVTVMVSRIRSKLAHDPLGEHYLVTVRGRGYRFAEPHELDSLTRAE